MPFKIAIIGAGSVGFTGTLVRDILAVPELQDCEIALMDIDKNSLELVRSHLAHQIRENKCSTRLTATTDRRKALSDTRYVIVCFRIGGLEAFKLDIEIPLRYRIDQCVGDTLGPGGIFYGQRGIPEILKICSDMRELSEPNAMLLNYANPNAMMTWAANTYGGVRCVGLCHGVHWGRCQLASIISLLINEGKKEGDPGYRKLEYRDIDIVCAGINHQTWYLKVGYNGKDWCNRLLEGFEKHPVYSKEEKVRIDVLRRFGYYSTESNGHLSEYLPWYRKRPEEFNKWFSLERPLLGETGGYLRVVSEGNAMFPTHVKKWLNSPVKPFSQNDRSNEHGSFIIESLETGRIYRGHFNVINNSTISNLPPDCVVEVPGYVDRNGISIPAVGPLPDGPAAVCNASINVQRLSVNSAVSGDDRLLRQAMLLDPLTSAVCTPPEVWQLCDDMLLAESKWLPQYSTAIRKLKEGGLKNSRIKTSNYTGMARVKVRTLRELLADKKTKEKNLQN